MAMLSQPESCWRRPHTAAGAAELEESTPEERSGLQHTASVISAGLVVSLLQQSLGFLYLFHFIEIL